MVREKSETVPQRVAKPERGKTVVGTHSTVYGARGRENQPGMETLRSHNTDTLTASKKDHSTMADLTAPPGKGF